jgi:benzylsuccinate CoA-transferase BbsF subunit
VSQIETAVYSLSEMVLRYSARGEVMGRRGNECEYAAPHGVYPCRGDDRWIAIAVFGDDEWRALCGRMGPAGPGGDARFDTAPGRLAHRDEIDAAVAAWTPDFDAHALMQQLQQAGVEAGVVQSFDDLLHDPQLAARGHFETLAHVHLGEMPFENYAIRPAESPPRLRFPGPNLGEHTREILQGVLGLSDGEIEALARRDVLV